MHTIAQINEPDRTSVTITITQTLKEWKALRLQLQDEWPSSDLTRQIDSVVSKIERVVWAEGSQQQ